MNIAHIEVFPLNLPMKDNFSISGGVVGNALQGAPHVYVKITDEDGVSGWGEARPSPRWSYETRATVVTTVEQYFRPALVGQRVDDLFALRQLLDREIAGGFTSGQPIAKAAIDTALHDLLGKQQGKRIGEMWAGPQCNAANLSYLISTRDPEEAARKASHARDCGYLGVDVKIGLDPQKDIQILEAVHSVASGLFFRVDANQAYNLPAALQVARHLGRLGVDVFEQPLAANGLADMALLRRKSPVPIAVDESVWSPSDVIQAIRMEACDYVVIKLTKMGGLQNARLCGEIARAAHLGLLGGGLTESRLGLAASAQLFHFLGITTPVDLNGPLFLLDDPVSDGPVITHGSVRLAQSPGVGCTMDLDKVAQYLWRG